MLSVLSVIAAMRHFSVVGGKRHLRCQIPQDSTVAGSIYFTEEEVDGRPCPCDARYRKVQHHKPQRSSWNKEKLTGAPATAMPDTTRFHRGRLHLLHGRGS